MRALVVQGMALAETNAPSTPGAPSMSPMLMMVVAMFAIMYFLMIRPNQKREKERQQMLANLSKGDRVVTAGGICGTVVGLGDKMIVLRISDEPGVKVECLRSSVSRVASKDSKDG
jgi:preprotein translocase subunit YajC